MSYMAVQTWCGQNMRRVSGNKVQRGNSTMGVVAGSSLPETGTSWECWSGLTVLIVPGQTGSVWSFLSLWPLCWRLISAESGLQHKWRSVLINCGQLHWLKCFYKTVKTVMVTSQKWRWVTLLWIIQCIYRHAYSAPVRKCICVILR